MNLSTNTRAILLTVERGNTRVPLRTFTPGDAVPPIAVGVHAEWSIEAAGVEHVHLYLDFDGSEVHVCPATSCARVLVGEVEIHDWVTVPLPADIHFGEARITVLRDEERDTRPQARGPYPGLGQTQLLDLSQLGLAPLLATAAETIAAEQPWSVKAPVLQCIPISAAPSLSQAPAPEIQSTTRPTELATSTLASAPPPHAGTARSPQPSLYEVTLCDGGALRELADQAVAATRLPENEPPADTTSPLAARLRADVASSWTRSSPAKKAIVALLPVVAILAIWSRSRASEAHPSPTVASSTTAPMSAPKPPSSESPPPSARQPSPETRSFSTSPTSSASPPRSPQAQPQPAREPQPEPKLDEPTPDESRERRLQRQALQNAFEGNLPSAAESYTALAQSSSRARLFEVAARAAQRGRVRTP